MYNVDGYFVLILSLSARRAWIEIDIQALERPRDAVALRKESVDRNNPECVSVDKSGYGRSPQGERG